jgi:hypothetical protein
VCSVPSTFTIFKRILKVVYYEGILYHHRFSLDQLSCVKQVVFQFYLHLGKLRKVGWMGDDSHVVFGKKFPGEEGSVRLCIAMMQQPALLLP